MGYMYTAESSDVDFGRYESKSRQKKKKKIQYQSSDESNDESSLSPSDDDDDGQDEDQVIITYELCSFIKLNLMFIFIIHTNSTVQKSM